MPVVFWQHTGKLNAIYPFQKIDKHACEVSLIYEHHATSSVFSIIISEI